MRVRKNSSLNTTEKKGFGRVWPYNVGDQRAEWSNEMAKFEADTNGHSKVLFCNSAENVPSCLSFLNRQLQTFGLRPVGFSQAGGAEETDIPALLNTIYELIVIHQQDSKLRDANEGVRMRQNADLTHLQQSRAKLRDEVEQLKREKQQFAERERQANERCRQTKEDLTRSNQELDKLRKETAARTETYQHEQRRWERELNRIKSRLNELSSGGNNVQSGMTAGISLTNLVGFRRADDGAVTTGRRRWCTAERSELELYKQLLAQQDDANRAMLVENAQLKRSLTKLVLATKRMARPEAQARATVVALDGDLSEFADTSGPEGTVNSSCLADLPTDMLLTQLDSQWQAACSCLNTAVRPPADSDSIEVQQLRSKLAEYERVLRAHEQLVRVGLAKLNPGVSAAVSTSTSALPTGVLLDVPSSARRSLSLHTTPTKNNVVTPAVVSEQSSPNCKPAELQARAESLKAQLLQLVLDENGNAEASQSSQGNQ